MIQRPARGVQGAGLLVATWTAAVIAAAAGDQPATQAPTPWRIVVAAGDVDRSGLPLRVPVTVPGTLADAAVWVRPADGPPLTGQLVEPDLLAARAKPAPAGTVHRDLLFVLPSLPAGGTAEVTAELSPPPADPGPPPRLAWVAEPAAVGLQLAGRPLVRYEMPGYDAGDEARRVATYKPFHHVFDPVHGVRLTKGVGGLYTHHRGIFFGYNRIAHGERRETTSDCWHCTGRSRQEHRDTLVQEAGPVAGLQRLAIDWIGSDAAPILRETRELRIVPTGGGTVIDFASRLSAAAPVALDGDPQHAGVHFRAANEVAESTKGETYYLRPDGRGQPGDYRNWPQQETYVDAPWHAASFVVDGRRYTVLRADRPANPGEARMSERDYARFGSYFAHELGPDDPLEVGYRFWVQPGEMTVAEANRIAADYARPAGTSVRPAESAAP